MLQQNILHQAIAAAKAGRKAEARQLLKQMLQTDPNHEQAWLWLSAAVENDADRIRCLERVLIINPDNAMARKGLAHLQVGGDTILLAKLIPAGLGSSPGGWGYFHRRYPTDPNAAAGPLFKLRF